MPLRVDCLTCISLHEHEGIYHTSRVLTTRNNGHKSDHIWLHIGLEDLLEHFKGFTRLLILTIEFQITTFFSAVESNKSLAINKFLPPVYIEIKAGVKNSSEENLDFTTKPWSSQYQDISFKYATKLCWQKCSHWPSNPSHEFNSKPQRPFYQTHSKNNGILKHSSHQVWLRNLIKRQTCLHHATIFFCVKIN